MKFALSFFLCLSYSILLQAQTVEINLDLSDQKPSFGLVGKLYVELSVQSPDYENLLRHYDADPFQKPVIVSNEPIQKEIAKVLEQYLSAIGIQRVEESDNAIYIKVVLCSLNYLLGKGWTATTKLDIQVVGRNREVFSRIITGYTEAGGKEDEVLYAEKALNLSFYKAFESVNWQQISDELPSYGAGVSTQTDTPATKSNAGKTQWHFPGTEKDLSTGTYYALLIAIEDYQYINKLDQPVKDAVSLRNLLNSSYNFLPENIFLLKNPTREEIIDKLDMLVSLVKKEDNLLIFYAGHGYWDEARETGYWLPVNAKRSSTANWLRNSTIQEYIGDIKSKHTLLIADACFGGGIFKTRKAFEDAPSSINQVYELSSRKAITSGMLNEVPDRSIFFEYLFKRLEENEQKYTSSLQLFSSFRTAVMNNSDNVPQYGTIQKAGDEGGDFVFVKPYK